VAVPLLGASFSEASLVGAGVAVCSAPAPPVASSPAGSFFEELEGAVLEEGPPVLLVVDVS
jgi:hypothetical protein